jgi:Ca2+-binding RTX toxin-like protein
MSVEVSDGFTGNFVLSEDGTRLYVAGPDGVLRIFNAASGALISSSALGTSLGAIAISPDGSFLLITEQEPARFFEAPTGWPDNETDSAIYKVDLATGAVETLIYSSEGYEYVLADVAITNAGTAVFTQNILPGWSGWTSLVTLDLATGGFTSTGGGGYYQAGSVTIAPDGATVLYGQLNLSSAEAYVLSPTAVTLDSNGIYQNDVYGYAQGAEAYTGAGDSGRVAISTGGVVHLWDGEFDYLQNLTTLNSELSDIVGLRFSEDGRTLYALSSGTDQIYAISLADYSIASTFAVGADVVAASAWGDELVAGPSDRFLLVSTAAGVFRVDLGDNVASGTEFADLFEGGSTRDVYTGLGGDDSIFGYGGNDQLDGDDGNDLIDGGIGTDRMRGGTGDDIYVVDAGGDRVIELAGGGTDTVQSSRSYTLGAELENLTLTGTDAIDGTGNALANRIVGNDAANILNGRGGADVMEGGLGGDTYWVDHAGDVIVETGADIDTVIAAASYTLGADVENLVLKGAGSLSGTGNDLANVITGNAGSNILDGAGGADRMKGGAGDDVYHADDFSDRAIEDSAAGGFDVVRSTASFTLGANVEDLMLTGLAAIDGTGNADANGISGNSAANRLNGGQGNDVLRGWGGADSFLFNTALGPNNVDHIVDLKRGTDVILLENAVFKGLAAGALSANALANGSAAGDADDRIIYDAATGSLYYDSDGTGAATQVLFAVLDTQPAALSASDFAVI